MLPPEPLKSRRSSAALVAGIIVGAGLVGAGILLISHNRTIWSLAGAAASLSTPKSAAGVASPKAASSNSPGTITKTASASSAKAADAKTCLDLSKHAPLALDGKLVATIFPGPPDFADVRKGDDPEAGYVLQLKDSICIVENDEDTSADSNVKITEVQLASAQDQSAISADMRALIGLEVHAQLSAAQLETTAHQYRPLVGWVSHIGPFDGRSPGMTLIPRTLRPVAFSADQQSEPGTAATTVRAFYYALGQGNGEDASELVIPEKRQVGAYSTDSIHRFYGPLPEPVRLLTLAPQGTNQYLVTYAFGTSARRCQGQAVVTTTQRDGLNLIEKIQSQETCTASGSGDKRVPAATLATPEVIGVDPTVVSPGAHHLS
jgi:hypothetical protein